MSNKLPPGHGTQRVSAYVTSISFFRATGSSGDGSYATQLGCFLSQEIARVAVLGKGGWGCDGSVTPVTMHVVVYNDPATGREVMREVGSDVNLDFKDSDPRVAAALAKLSLIDISALHDILK